MQIHTDFSPLQKGSPRPLILALGTFDGVHLGHQSLIRQVIQDAEKLHGRSAVLTFQQHPQEVLQPSARPRLLTSLEHKLYYFEALGLDECFAVPFTPHIASMEAEAFVRDLLVGKLQVRQVCMGHDARFGKGRKGDAALMRQLAEKFKFHFVSMPAVRTQGELVSSSRIRTLIQSGDLDGVRACLGRPYSVIGQVVHGDGRGKTLGFPTANLKIEAELMPPGGVYAVRAREMELYRTEPLIQYRAKEAFVPGVLNYGCRPTFHPGSPRMTAEVFMLDFEGELYGKELEIFFVSRLRGEQTFADAEALKKQIRADVLEARNRLGKMI